MSSKKTQTSTLKENPLWREFQSKVCDTSRPFPYPFCFPDTPSIHVGDWCFPGWYPFVPHRRLWGFFYFILTICSFNRTHCSQWSITTGLERKFPTNLFSLEYYMAHHYRVNGSEFHSNPNYFQSANLSLLINIWALIKNIEFSRSLWLYLR